MLNPSAGQIVPRFIVWNNIMPKISEIKKGHRKFLMNWRVEIREFPLSCIFGDPKTAQKIGDDKKLVMYCI